MEWWIGAGHCCEYSITPFWADITTVSILVLFDGLMVNRGLALGGYHISTLFEPKQVVQMGDVTIYSNKTQTTPILFFLKKIVNSRGTVSHVTGICKCKQLTTIF